MNKMSLLELAKKLNIARRNIDTLSKLVWEGLQKNIVMNDDTMIGKRTSEVLDEVHSAYWKKKFQADFIVFIDHKIACRKAEEIHILNDIDTLGT